MVARRRLVALALMLLSFVSVLSAHSGPPFPIVSNRTVGAYEISVWTDPDSTDDGSAGGRFWVTIRPAGGATVLPAGTQATISLAPAERPQESRAGATTPVADDPSHRYAALVMDHEGRFRVVVDVDGPLGKATVEGEVDATYDLRPAPFMIAVYLVPFLLIGFLWVKLLLRRRRAS